MAADPPAPAADPAADGSADPITPYDRLVWTGEEVEQLLATGARREELVAYFGPREYDVLARLARVARDAVPARGACRTLVVPGSLGSQLGRPRREPLPRDIVWLDPIDIGLGRLTELALPGTAPTQAYGVLLYTYLGLLLNLRAAGLDAAFHAYDWRRGVEELARELAGRLRAEPSPRIALVAHSFGGLVARAALAFPGGEKVERLVLLGTPNHGSLAALQALRGTYWAVRKIAQLDLHHSSETLARRVFTTFPSLYHMLPSAPGEGELDLLDPRAWPMSEPRPRPQLLESARGVARLLAPPDERCTAIVGVGQPTAIEVRRGDDEFVYRITRQGDGTVPAASARLAGAGFHAAVSHGNLARDPTVTAAVIDLLCTGSTERLPARWRTRSLGEQTVGDRELARLLTEKVHWSRLSPEERRVFLEYLNEPPRFALRSARTAAGRRLATPR